MNTNSMIKSSIYGGKRRFALTFLFSVMIMALIPSCAKVMTQQGKASYYADKFKGRRTASGEKFRQHKRTAASLTIPLGTKVRVTNLENGKSVKVRINDRGPYVKGRILDLSKKAARRIDMLREGVVPVRLRYKLKKNHR
jgi:rare lipoprotein A